MSFLVAKVCGRQARRKLNLSRGTFWGRKYGRYDKLFFVEQEEGAYHQISSHNMWKEREGFVLSPSLHSTPSTTPSVHLRQPSPCPHPPCSGRSIWVKNSMNVPFDIRNLSRNSLSPKLCNGSSRSRICLTLGAITWPITSSSLSSPLKSTQSGSIFSRRKQLDD